MEYSGAGGKVIHEKNQKQKISWHCPFKIVLKVLLFGAASAVVIFVSHTSLSLYGLSSYKGGFFG